MLIKPVPMRELITIGNDRCFPWTTLKWGVQHSSFCRRPIGVPHPFRRESKDIQNSLRIKLRLLLGGVVPMEENSSILVGNLNATPSVFEIHNHLLFSTHHIRDSYESQDLTEMAIISLK